MTLITKCNSHYMSTGGWVCIQESLYIQGVLRPGGFASRGGCLHPSGVGIQEEYVFTPVCDSVHRGCLPHCVLGYTHPWSDTAWSDTPYAYTPPPPPTLRCTVNERCKYMSLRFTNIPIWPIYYTK